MTATGNAATVYFTPIAEGSGGTSFHYAAKDNLGVVDGTPNTATITAGIGAHSASWWCGTGSVYWDGVADASTVKHSPTYATLPKAELTYKVDTNADGVVDSQKYLLIGDFNRNGLTDNGEHTYLMSVADAKALCGCTIGDARILLGKELVATWQNSLAENPIGSAATANTPAWFVQEAVDWLSQVSGTTKTLSGIVASGKIGATIWSNDGD